ncbi:unnamed protein product [Candidula unifasciata]|uniref:Hexosyltransferase n=1 Tax=Candidula unifasciata TaxID=100452 RepID=A0A8S3YTL1_9EUPU|nr:unnamed protein product [Candidula unifasciata]
MKMATRLIGGILTSATFWFIIILSVTMIWYGGKHWSNRKNTAFSLFTWTRPYMTSKNITLGEQPTNNYNDLMQQNRLAEVKREFLDLSLTNETMYPANRTGNYIFSNPNVCKDVSNIDFIIIVHTAPTQFERRQRIRATFANTSLFYPAQIRAAFLLGITTDSKLTEMLWREHRTYNDTVMGDFIDDYHNLTLKGVMGLRWVKDHCPNAAFVLKIDDDVVINMFALVHLFLPQMKAMKRTIFCMVLFNGTMFVHRTGKWKVDSHILPNRTHYPFSYCTGFAVILTPDLINELYQAANVSPFFWIDDVYLFGVLPYVIGNINFTHCEFNIFLPESYKKAVNCTLPQKMAIPMFSLHLHDRDFWTCWYQMKSEQQS